MGRITHFEIHADDPERASRFYTAIFGWTITKWNGPMEYWLVGTGEDSPGIDGGIVRRRGDRPPMGAATNAYTCTATVDSLDSTIAKVESNGGMIVVPKMEVPGVSLLAYAQDTEGNIFGMLQPSDST